MQMTQRFKQLLKITWNLNQMLSYAVVDRAIRHDDGPFHWYCDWGQCEPHNFFGTKILLLEKFI